MFYFFLAYEALLQEKGPWLKEGAVVLNQKQYGLIGLHYYD